MKILIIGSNGLIGSNITKCLLRKKEWLIYPLIRSKKRFGSFDNTKNSHVLELNDFYEIEDFVSLIIKYDINLIINCAGITKHNPEIKDFNKALYLNSVFPKNLSEICKNMNIRFIHLSSDCVFSGKAKMYDEDSIKDAKDFYGITKSLGEINDSNNLTIRTSTIGHEINTSYGLLNWFLKQDECLGYKNAIFSGPTTLELSKIIRDLIIPNKKLTGILNISAEPIDKYSLLEIIKKTYFLKTTINPSYEVKINRSLNSNKFKKLTNYSIKSWEQMIYEMYINK
tara:strand:- start:31914 stop:32765 length:852 start_codon:yes stop_codon:yes gene_type:complete